MSVSYHSLPQHTCIPEQVHGNSTVLLGYSRRLINFTELADDQTPRYCEAHLGLHCFTGEDDNCAFKGKVGPLKKLLKKHKYMDTFIKLGTNWEPDEQTVAELEEFTCNIYGYPNTRVSIKSAVQC